ncbi:unnamed protein product, partial [Ascophyllum nodosum]
FGGPGGPWGPGGFRRPGFGGPPPLFVRGPGWRRGWGPGWGPRVGGPPPPGPFGGPWCCWPFLCVIFFVVIASAGVTTIQTTEDCSEDENCTTYDAVYAVAVGIAILVICCCCCVFCANPREGSHDPQDGTAAETAQILATEAYPPIEVYATNPYQASAPAFNGKYTTTKV